MENILSNLQKKPETKKYVPVNIQIRKTVIPPKIRSIPGVLTADKPIKEKIDTVFESDDADDAEMFIQPPKRTIISQKQNSPETAIIVDARDKTQISRKEMLANLTKNNKSFKNLIKHTDKELIEDSAISEEITTVIEPEPEPEPSPPIIQNIVGSVPITIKKKKLPPGFVHAKFDVPSPEPRPPPSELDKATFENEFEERLPSTPKVILKSSAYYMNNRKAFKTKINSLLYPYKNELDAAKDEPSFSKSATGDFELLTHQKIVRDYLNLYTPYRGLLLYHGLGSGKTCTSIAIAEGMKSKKHVFVMTPASLRDNFFGELKKCGDPLFKKNQFWEFISVSGRPERADILSEKLNLPKDKIVEDGGAWLVNIKKPSNFADLNDADQKKIDDQINLMIKQKYTGINYNGITKKRFNEMTKDNTVNPFDHTVVIIDEAHNLVSRIVNKLPKTRDSKKQTVKSVSSLIYEQLLTAVDVKVVLLTGTPIINYPHEVSILFNILRGCINTWTLPINVNTSKKINKDEIIEMFKNNEINTYDYVDYRGNTVYITRNPFGFINKPDKVKIGGKIGTDPDPNKKIKPPSPKKTKKTGKSSVKPAKKSSRKTKRRINKTPDDTNDSLNDWKNGASYAEPETPHSDNVYLSEKDTRDLEQYNRNPSGGENEPHVGGGKNSQSYSGVVLDDTGNISDSDFIESVITTLQQNGLYVTTNKIQPECNLCLPENQEEFLNMFVENDNGQMKNNDLFKRRILGLTSYFRSAQENLLPRFVYNADGGIFHIVRCQMSDHQFGVYEKIRHEEDKREKNVKKSQKKNEEKGISDLYTISSTYRVFSRAACNFAFPTPPGRPTPGKIDENTEIDEGESDNLTEEFEEAEEADAEEADAEEADAEEDIPLDETTIIISQDKSQSPLTDAAEYNKRIRDALDMINAPAYLSSAGLDTYSPKFKYILENITDPANEGLHLLYSQFRNIEGVEILKMALVVNGYAEFKIHKDRSGEWSIIEETTDVGKPKFALHTGTESPEIRDIVRNIYNNSWELVPQSIATKLKEKYIDVNGNLNGDVIKLLMITASGAEGINLKNTRFVHITEPYWNLTRIEQVVGRARRIRSHDELPEEKRDVKVFLYLSVLSEQHKADDKNIELRIRDVSRFNDKIPITTDESLFEGCIIKDKINQQILRSIKETAIDCDIYAESNTAENLVCYGFGSVKSNDFASHPSIEIDAEDAIVSDVSKTEDLKLSSVKINGILYKYDSATKNLYDAKSVERYKAGLGNILFIGRLETINEKIVINTNAEL